ncbi:MAG: carboxypeptidase regulatory-like domain-containing protein [Candidatus Zixiibacteriota bacterium]
MKKVFITTLILAITGLLFANPSYWGTTGLLHTIAAENNGAGYLSVSFYGNYFQEDLKRQISDADLMHYTERHANGWIAASYTLWDFMEVSGGVRALAVTDDLVFGSERPTEFDLDDSFVGLKLSHFPADWLGISGYGRFTFPTGSQTFRNERFANQDNTYTGVGAVTIAMDEAIPNIPVHLHLNGGYIANRTTAEPDAEEETDNIITYGAAAEFHTSKMLNVFVDYYGEISDREDYANPMKITPGIRFSSGQFAFDFGVDIGIGDRGVQPVRNLQNMSWKIVSGISFMVEADVEPPKLVFADVSGRVIDEDTGDPIEGARITTDDTTWNQPVTTDQNGSYKITLSQGVHNVLFSAPEYKEFSKSVAVRDSYGIALDAQLKPSTRYGTIAGKISNAKTEAGLSAQISFPEENIDEIVAGNNGVYKKKLPVGAYAMKIIVPEFRTRTEVVVIEANKTIQKDVAMQPIKTETDGKLKGNIVDERAGKGLVGFVKVMEPGFEEVQSDPETGAYSMNLPEGTYNLQIVAPGYQIKNFTAEIKAGETTIMENELKPIPHGTVTGKVTVTKTGEPLRATIVFPDTDIEPIVANANGIYKVTLTPGTYSISAEYPGHITQVFPIVVKEDETTVRDFELVKPGEKITLEGIYFEFDKAQIKPESKPTLDRAIKILKDNPDIDVTIEGHTDDVGTHSYNLDLSHRRADAVKAYLVREGGIDADRLETTGKGETEPIASNETPQGRSLNRRIEFIVEE